ncbi:hypothetical protein D9V29_12740 [Mycetocola manganoxydans]|uniref:Uncharacterized protein n=1 Tax=Mycetocola manganoxydans TaxID=699879 RepID=A0A3L6ZLX2_9MICO|nr:hypothetical protein [Mycetocola manganoxydans]RLP68843.1 hypothetical protein D9V29_12740 [Mycetocola manganoxydans]GHD51149.1 hypothetical protein GCM10008097_25730 [Mycetocola manganoxydans]
MSNPANSQTPYGQPAGAPAGYPQQSHRLPLDKSVLRQVMFGGAVVVGYAVISSVLAIISRSVYGFRAEVLLGTFWSVFIALVFVAGAAVSALYIASLAKAVSAVDLLRKLAIAAAVGAAALLVINFIWSVVTGGEYLVQSIVSSGIVGSISTGLIYGSLFALGILIARLLPPRQPAPQGAGQQPYGQPAPHSAQPQGYPQQQQQPHAQQPQAPHAPQGYAPQNPGQQQPPFPPQA